MELTTSKLTSQLMLYSAKGSGKLEGGEDGGGGGEDEGGGGEDDYFVFL